MKKNTVIYSLILAFILCACRYDDISRTDSSKASSNFNYQEDTKLKTDFAKALVHAVSESQALRDFIKNEALKKVTKDFDVVYYTVKSKNVASGTNLRTTGSSSLRDLILPYFAKEGDLSEIEKKLPLLTIFVPDLQDGSFSAENWNTATQIPYIAVRSYETNDVMCYGVDKEFNLPGKYMPDFPVLVIKDNERLISNQTQEQFDKLSTRILTSQNTTNGRIIDDVSLRFIDDNFDPSYQPASNPVFQPFVGYPRVDQIHLDAYNAYKNYTPGGWQRDYIYYGLTPTKTEGGINPTYREYLTSFKLTGDPQAAYNYISNSQDPKVLAVINGSSAWTDGAFEIGISLAYGAKNSNLGLEMTKGFSANPNDLFEITYDTYGGWWSFGLSIKTPTITGLKMMDFYDNPTNKIEFPVWDLNNFSNQWKITFEEVDLQVTHTDTKTVSNKYNANFGLDFSTGEIKKIGLKFGASYEQEKSNTYVSQYTEESNPLKSSDVNFYDNVVDFNSSNQLVPRKYNTGKVEFELRPRLVY